MKVIAFGHRKRVGKDTACKFINSYYRMANRNANVQKKALASKLKQQCYELYAWAGLKNEEYYEDTPHMKEIILPVLQKSPRQIWIEYGTLVGRAVYSYTWADYLFNNTKCDLLIISDLRFPEEANRVQALGGKVYRIDRPSIPHTSDIADDPLSNWTGWDGVVLNDKELSDFHRDIISLISPYLEIKL